MDPTLIAFTAGGVAYLVALAALVRRILLEVGF